MRLAILSLVALALASASHADIIRFTFKGHIASIEGELPVSVPSGFGPVINLDVLHASLHDGNA